ncbi:MAG: hypothetical protein ACOY4Q_04050 [Bacillota bacterium]
MEGLHEPRCRYYKLYLAGLAGQAVITVDGSRGRIRVETGEKPVAGLPFGRGYPAVWLVGPEDTAFFIGVLELSAAGCRAAGRGFYPLNVGGTGKVIEDFFELLVTLENGKRPVSPGKRILYRQTIGCFIGRMPPVNPLLYKSEPFDPPLENYIWWKIVGNLCVAEHEAGCPVKYRKEGVF